MAEEPKSFMQSLRKKMAIFFWITLIFFMAMVILRWGANFSGPQGNKGNEEDVIAYVGKDKVNYRDYALAIEGLRTQTINSGEDLTDYVDERLREQAFNQLVNQKLLDEHYQDKNIEITNEELWQEIKNNPPAQIRNNEAFLTNGRFDLQKYQQQLYNPGADWSMVENYIRANLPQKEMQQMVNSMAYITSVDAKKWFDRNNKEIKINYLRLSPEQVDLEEGAVDISEDNLQEYYDSHKDEFYREKLAVMNYVSLPVVTTKADSQEAYEMITTIKERIEEGANFEMMATEYSDDPGSAPNGGKLGYVRKGQMVPEFEEVAFSLPDSQVSDPVRTEYGWHLIYITDRQEPETELQSPVVFANHILIKLEPTPSTRDSVRTLADELRERAKENSLPEEADSMGLDYNATAPFGPNDNIQGIGFHSELNNFAFKADVGTVYRTLADRNNYYVYELKSRQDEGIPPFDEIKDEIKQKLITNAKSELLVKRATELMNKLKKGADFFDTARELELEADSTGYFTMNDFIPELGDAPYVIGTAFGLSEQNPVSSVVKNDEGDVFVIELVDQKTPASETFTRQKSSIVQQMFMSRKDAIYNEWFISLRNNADIDDKRLSILGVD